MRLLVISDSHRRSGTVERIIRAQPTAEHIFFLGDVTGDIEDMPHIFPDRSYHIVSGNCDFCSLYPSNDTAVVGGVPVFYTHGHTYGVRGGIDRLVATAKQRDCRIALYGHTHIPQTVYENGVYVVNPGSCAESRNGPNSYAVIDILPAGILPAILTV